MDGKDPDNTAVTGQVDQQPLLAAQPGYDPNMGQPVM